MQIEDQVCLDIEQTKKSLIGVYTTNGFKGWNKLYGDICTRVFSHYISQYIPSNKYKVSVPNAYILGFSTEFDLLIVKNEASNIEFSNVYKPEDVYAGLEFKAHGIYGSKNQLGNAIGTIRKKFTEVNSKYPDIRFRYLTYSEVVNPMIGVSKKHLLQSDSYFHPAYSQKHEKSAWIPNQ